MDKPVDKKNDGGMLTYDSVLFAKYLLAFAYSIKVGLNMTKLQKILYIIYGYYLGQYNHRIVDEHPKIWPFGPVFPRVHKKVDPTRICNVEDPEFAALNGNDDLKADLRKILENYGHFTANELSNWSHMKGSPWERTVKENDRKWNQPIPDDYIQEYFSQIETIK